MRTLINLCLTSREQRLLEQVKQIFSVFVFPTLKLK